MKKIIFFFFGFQTRYMVTDYEDNRGNKEFSFERYQENYKGGVQGENKLENYKGGVLENKYAWKDQNEFAIYLKEKFNICLENF